MHIWESFKTGNPGFIRSNPEKVKPLMAVIAVVVVASIIPAKAQQERVTNSEYASVDSSED